MNNVLLVQAAQEEILTELLQTGTDPVSVKINELVLTAAKVREIELTVPKPA